MSRKTILGRSGLSFDATDGVLDIEQILNLTPWNQIDEFVQHNFMQNILEQFNDQISLDPKRNPPERKKPSPKGTRQNHSIQPKKENPVEINNEPSSVDGLEAAVEENKETKERIKGAEEEEMKDTAKKRQNEGKAANVKKSRSSKANVVESREFKNKEKLDKVPSSKTKKVSGNEGARKKSKGKSAKDSTKIGSPSSEDLTKIESTVTEDLTEIENTITQDLTRTKNTSAKDLTKIESTNAQDLMQTEVANATVNGREELEYQTATEISKNSESMLFSAQTSTPKRHTLSLSESTKQKTPKDTEDKKPVLHVANLNNNNNYSRSMLKIKTEKEKKKMNAKCKNETSKVKKCSNKNTVEKEHGVRKLKKLQSKEVKTVSNNNNCDEKITSNTGKKKIGQFEKRLREKEEKRRKRKILRHEKKAQRAMQEFSKHVTNIAKEMGYLPGKDSKNRYSSAGRHDVSSESSSSSYTSCSCSNSSSSSSYTSCSCSCSCSSCDTCSCNDSDDSYGTDEYSEFTVGSSSECGCGCDSSSTSESSSSD